MIMAERCVLCCVVLQCDVCQKSFVRPCLLHSHVRLAHPPDSTVAVYECTESGCNRTYASVRSLQQHVTSFHEGQEFDCPQCQQSLSTKVSAMLLHAFKILSTCTTASHDKEIFTENFILTLRSKVVTKPKAFEKITLQHCLSVKGRPPAIVFSSVPMTLTVTC